MNLLKYFLLVSCLMGSFFAQEAHSQVRGARNFFHIQGGFGIISIDPQVENEVKKNGNILGVQMGFETWIKRNAVILGAGFKKTQASGEVDATHQEFILHNPYLDLVIKRIPQKGQPLSFGFWSQLVMGKVAGLKYYERDTFQFAPYVGGIVQYRMPQTSGADLIISSGVLYQPGIGGVASFVIPVQLGLSMPMGSPAPPPRNAAPAVVIPSGPPPVAVTPAPPLAPIKAEIVVGSDIFVFEVESDELRGGAQKFTKELAQILIANAPSWKEVEVVGYSSPLEPDEVAQRRSEKVRQALIAAGIPIGQIKVTANKNKSYSQVVKGAPQRVDVIIASSEGTEVSKLKTVVGPLQEKWANLSYRFRHQALGFELGHDYLTKPAQKMIIKIAQILKDKSSEWSQLVIYGYTDALGIKSANVKLAKKRAANVLNIFAKQGLDPNKMEAIGMTAESPAKSENPEEKEEVSLESNPEDRRVEIEIMGIKNREELDRLMETLSEN